jgi:hypothetical protein
MGFVAAWETKLGAITRARLLAPILVISSFAANLTRMSSGKQEGGREGGRRQEAGGRRQEGGGRRREETYSFK